jgi:iron complex outermembrane receptor protein
MKNANKTLLALCVQAALLSSPSFAQELESEGNDKGLEKITVTAQKRSQSIQDVPISIATLSGEHFESIFSGGDDILALAVRVPGLYAESSNGRGAPVSIFVVWVILILTWQLRNRYPLSWMMWSRKTSY